MNLYQEELIESRKTGRGISVRFQESENHLPAINNYDCPYCGAKYGEPTGWEYSNKSKKIIISDKYETPKDIEFMCNHIGYSWTEDCKCGNCGKIYSQHNGC